MIDANLSSNNYLAPPAGFPFRLYVGNGNETVQAFLPKGTLSVVAVVRPDYVANVHMALYAAPSETGESDGAPIEDFQVDAEGVRASVPVTLALEIPTDAAPAEYIVRLWFDNAVGGTEDTVARDATVTDTTTQPKMPYGVSVTAFYIT